MPFYHFKGLGNNGFEALGEKIFFNKIASHQDLPGFGGTSGSLTDFLTLNPCVQGYVHLVYSHRGFLVHSRLEATGAKRQNQKVTADSLTGTEKTREINEKIGGKDIA